MKDYKEEYEHFWKDIVEDQDGNLNKDQIMRELSDFTYLINSISKLYSRITGNMCSKPMTKVEQVISLYEEQLDIKYEEGYQDGNEDGFYSGQSEEEV